MAQGKRSPAKSAGGKKRGRKGVIDVDATTQAVADEPVPAQGGDATAAGGEADADADVDTEELKGPDDAELVDVDVELIDPSTALPGPEPALVPAAPGRIGRVDPLTRYMQEIRRYPLLSREDEHALAKKFVETQDPEIAKQLVTANLRLVVKIAHEYRRAHRNLLDLVQEGNIGLMQAVKRYDPMRGVKLSSYAAWWIRAYMLKFILSNWRMVKIGTTQAQRKLFFNLRKEKEKLEKLGFGSDHKLLAERLQVTEAEVREMDQRLAAGDMSLDAPVTSEEGDGRTRMDSLADGNQRPDAAAEEGEFRSLLRQKVEEFAVTLKGRDADLFRARWLAEDPKTLQEIGDRFGISRERARQLEKRLLDKLRLFLKAELGSAVDIGVMRDE